MKRRFAPPVLTLLALVCLGQAVSAQDLDENPYGRRMGLLREDISKIASVVRVTSVSPVPFAPNVLRPQAAVTAVDNSAGIPPVGDQGYQGSCTAWALGYYHKTQQEYLERHWSVTDPNHQFSPAFIYNHINGGGDNGSFFSDGMQFVVDHGCATKAEMPYSDSNYTLWPAESVYENALQFRAQQANYLDVSTTSGVNLLKQHLANGNTAVLGIMCWDNFYLISSYGNTYCVADKRGRNWGSHAVCVVGYDDNRLTHDGMGAFRIVNSWGVGWGDAGWFWMSYTAVKNPDLSWQEAYYLTDRIGYSARLTARFEIDHGRRGDVVRGYGLQGGVGYSAWSKSFFSCPQMEEYCAYYGMAYQTRAFPSRIVIDLTDGVDYLNDRRVYLQAKDSVLGTTGVINYFSAYYSDGGQTGVSVDTPAFIPEGGSWATVAAYLGGQSRTAGPGQEYPTITAALAAAEPGDRVLVAPGTYSAATGEVFPLVLKSGVAIQPLVDASEVNLVGIPTASVFEAVGIASGSWVEVVGLNISGGGGKLVGGVRYGGAFYFDNAYARIRKCTLTGCSADVGGGAYVANGSTPQFKNCFIAGNSAQIGGGAAVQGASPGFANVVIHSNFASSDGAGIHLSGAGSPSVTNCTIYGNQSGASGGGLYQSAGTAVVINSIIWSNSAPAGGQIQAAGGSLAVTYSCVQGGWAGDGNIASDPLFVNPALKDFHLQSGSPCIDAGSTGGPFEDGSRPPGRGTARNDMGAYGGPGNRDWLPAQVITTVGHGPGYYYSTISEAMASASRGFTILVADGTYSSATGETFPIYLKPGVVLKRANENGRPVIQGVSSASVFVGAYITGDQGTAVDGFEIRGGGGTPVYTYQNGGAFNLSKASIEIRNCLITNNHVASGYGGGVYAIEKSNTRITNCVFTNNSASGPYGSGGAMYCWDRSNVVMTNCIVIGNSATNRGGGLCPVNDTFTFFINCLIANNTCNGDGGGLYAVTSSVPHLMNCTVVNNSSATKGGGLYAQYNSELNVTNCIVWGNTAPTDPQICLTINSTAKVGYSCIQNGYAGTGNISANPLFVNPASNWHLQSGSPCRDSGTDTGAPPDDLDGYPRPMGSGFDMGAYEYFIGAPCTVSQAKLMANNQAAQIDGAVCTAVFGDSFYVESDDRACGIRIDRLSFSPAEGDRLNVSGLTYTSDSGEKCIRPLSVAAAGTGSLSPVYIENRWLLGADLWYDSATGAGQKGIPGNCGPNNVGLLVQTSGVFTKVDDSTFTIDDGSAVYAKCIVPPGVSLDPGWRYVLVTGISSCEKDGSGNLRRLVRLRRQSDVVAFQ